MFFRFTFLMVALVAQLSPPNQSGVAMGHLHYKVRDVEANKKIFVRDTSGNLVKDRDGNLTKVNYDNQ